MNIRLWVYGILAIVVLNIPMVYKTIDSNLNKQEILIRKQKFNWLVSMVHIELDLSNMAKTPEIFLYHFNKALDYMRLELNMEQEDIDNLK